MPYRFLSCPSSNVLDLLSTMSSPVRIEAAVGRSPRFSKQRTHGSQEDDDNADSIVCLTQAHVLSIKMTK